VCHRGASGLLRRRVPPYARPVPNAAGTNGSPKSRGNRRGPRAAYVAGPKNFFSVPKKFFRVQPCRGMGSAARPHTKRIPIGGRPRLAGWRDEIVAPRVHGSPPNPAREMQAVPSKIRVTRLHYLAPHSAAACLLPWRRLSTSPPAPELGLIPYGEATILAHQQQALA
jgi:hypothetical protein